MQLRGWARPAGGAVGQGLRYPSGHWRRAFRRRVPASSPSGPWRRVFCCGRAGSLAAVFCRRVTRGAHVQGSRSCRSTPTGSLGNGPCACKVFFYCKGVCTEVRAAGSKRDSRAIIRKLGVRPRACWRGASGGGKVGREGTSCAPPRSLHLSPPPSEKNRGAPSAGGWLGGLSMHRWRMKREGLTIPQFHSKPVHANPFPLIP